MIKLLNTFSLMLLLSTISIGQNTFDLTVKIVNIKKIQGNLKTCLVSHQSEYLSNCKNGQEHDVTSSTQRVLFEGLQEGKYCVTLFHDVDDNGQLNTKGIFGMPSEPYGFSNNPKGFFGPPKYKKCTFMLTKNKEIVVKL